MSAAIASAGAKAVPPAKAVTPKAKDVVDLTGEQKKKQVCARTHTHTHLSLRLRPTPYAYALCLRPTPYAYALRLRLRPTPYALRLRPTPYALRLRLHLRLRPDLGRGSAAEIAHLDVAMEWGRRRTY